MNNILYRFLKFTLNLLLAFLIGAIFIRLSGEDPLNSYYYLFKGTFNNRLNMGGILEKLVPLFLTALAFAISVKVSVFNVGVEGELYLGALATALVAVHVSWLPTALGISLALGASILTGMLWAMIPTFLKVYLKINEVCVCILMNYVAIFIVSYFVNGPFSGASGAPASPAIPDKFELLNILNPSRANIGLIISIAIFIAIIWLFLYHRIGHKMKNTGDNYFFAKYVGHNVTLMIFIGMLISGGLGGLAGGIEVLGIYHVVLDNFSLGTAFDGMLISLMAGNKFLKIPFYSILISILKQGSLSLDRYTDVPKAIVEIIIVIFILLISYNNNYTNGIFYKNLLLKINFFMKKFKG